MYLAIGMTYEQYWEQESWLVKSYREAYKIKFNDVNYTAWLNGIYICQALQSGVPVMLNGIAKHPAELPKYPEKPHDFSEEQNKKREENRMQMQVAKMQEIADRFNATFKRRQEEKAKAEQQ